MNNVKDDSKKLNIAFDVQGTLVRTNSKQDSEAMRLLVIRLKKSGHKIIVWTGGEIEDAEYAVSQLNLIDYVDECRSKLGGSLPDIAFDDQSGYLAKLATIKV